MSNKNQPPKKNSGGSNGGKPRNDTGIFKFIVIAVLMTFIANLLIQSMSENSSNKMDYSEFINKIKSYEVKRAVFTTDKILITLNKDETEEVTEVVNDEMSDEERLKKLLSGDGGLFQASQIDRVYFTYKLGDPKILELLNEYGVEYTGNPNTNGVMDFFTQWVLPLLFFYGIAILMMSLLSKKMGSGGGFMNVGKSNAKMYLEEKTGVTFDDVAGQDEAKESLLEIVDYLHHPKKYVEIGAKQPKGALLVGPPGTGKTLLAKAVAGEANVAFFSLTGSDFVEMYVGVGASRVRDLFKKANEYAPCIIFIDEIDAIGKSRDSQMGGHDEREQTLNQLLSEMDGFDSSKGVVILGATNRPEILDKALLRPGRFDRRVIVERPDLSGRESILEVHVKKIRLASSVKLKTIALATAGAVGADLANMVNEAAIRAVRMGRKEVIQEDLMEAVEVVIAGKEKKDRIMSDKEKRIVAFHEIGHALASALQKNTQPVQKITIIPRTMGSLGYTMMMPEDEKYLTSKAEMLEEIVVLLAGRCAEVVEFNIETTGASNDIERATKMARAMVSLYGMSDKFGMMATEEVRNQYLDARRQSNCSDGTAKEVDEEVMEIINKCYKKAMQLLSDNREALTKISEYLIKKETITGEAFMQLLNNEEVTDVFDDESEEISIYEYLNPAPEVVEETKEDVTEETSTEEIKDKDKKEE